MNSLMNRTNPQQRMSKLAHKVACVFLSVVLAMTLSPFAAYAADTDAASASEPAAVATQNDVTAEEGGGASGEDQAPTAGDPAVANAAAGESAANDAAANDAATNETATSKTAGQGTVKDLSLFSVDSPVVDNELIVVYKGDAVGLDESLGVPDEDQANQAAESARTGNSSQADDPSQNGEAAAGNATAGEPAANNPAAAGEAAAGNASAGAANASDDGELSLRDVGAVDQEVIDDVDGASVQARSSSYAAAGNAAGATSGNAAGAAANDTGAEPAAVDAASAKALALQSADGSSQSAAAEGLSAAGDVAVVKLAEGTSMPEAMEQILSSDKVADVQPNFVYSQLYVPNDPDCNSNYQFYLWHTRTIDAWNRIRTNGTVTVAVVDSGIRGSHQDLRGNVLENLAYDAHFSRPMTIDDESNGHGTEVSGIISAHAGNGVGLAGTSYNAKILPVKIFYEVDGRVMATTSDLVRAYNYLEECLDQKKVNNLRVVNLSLGYPSTGSYANTDRQVQNAIGHLRDRGVLTVCAGGNITPSMPENAVVYPSDFDECFSVTSLDRNNKESSFTCINKFKDLSAPGESVFTTNMYGGYSAGSVDGSSFAAPQVAGAAALLWAANPKLSVNDVCAALKKTASPATLKHGSGSAGMLNVESAVDLVTRDDWQHAVETPASSRTNIANATVTLPERYFYYDGTSIKPEVQVREGTSHLRLGVDYILKYRNNVNAGTGTVEVEGRGAYVGTKTASFVIMPAQIESAWLNATSWTYRGSAISPGISIRADVAGISKTVARNITKSTSNFHISYSGSRVNVGTCVVKITGRGNYTGSASAKFTINKAHLNGLRLSSTSLPYTGSVLHPAVTVTANCGGTTKTVASGVRSSSSKVSVSYSAGSKNLGSYTVTVTGRGNYAGTLRATYKIVKPTPTVQYQAHVQKQGWQAYVLNGHLAGTTGKKLRVEALHISLANKPKGSNGKPISGSIQYRSHVQKVGWTAWTQNGGLSGTVGRGLRMEAVQIRLTGDMAKRYDVYYSAHCQKLGWSGWAKNGAKAGTQGYGYRMEALKIKLVPKGGPAPGKTSGAFYQKNAPVSKTSPTVQYSSHVQKVGWQFDVANGALSGTTGKKLREEAIRVKLYNKPKGSNGAVLSGSIQYRTHVQKVGWTRWSQNGGLSGTVGRGLRIEAVQIRLTGDMAKRYDVYYSVHCQKFGWTGWAKNGAKAGSQGYGYRMEAMKIKLVPKGHAAPGKTSATFHSKR